MILRRLKESKRKEIEEKNSIIILVLLNFKGIIRSPKSQFYFKVMNSGAQMRGGGVTSTVLSISVYITKHLSQFCCYHAVLQYSKAYSGLTVPVSEIMGVSGFKGIRSPQSAMSSENSNFRRIIDNHLICRNYSKKSF